MAGGKAGEVHLGQVETPALRVGGSNIVDGSKEVVSGFFFFLLLVTHLF